MIHHPMPSEPSEIDAMLSKYEGYLQVLAELHLVPLLRSRVGASDILQETFIDATRGWVGFRGKSENELRAWLRTILLNNVRKAIDFHIHAEKRSVRSQVSFHDLPGLQQSSVMFEEAMVQQVDSPSEQISKEELLLAVTDSLASLSQSDRRIVILRNFHNLGYQAVAEELGKSEAACRMMWLRAIEKLRDEFSKRRLL
jgi:RNA polymerase sigma-70 factor (ECF subfamily)